MGELDITVINKKGRSVANKIYYQGALKVIKPIYLNDSNFPTFYLSNVGGGFLDGDRYRTEITLEDNASLSLTTQGATKIYKTLKDCVKQYQTFNLGVDTYFEYVADPIIAYKDADYFQQNIFRLTLTSALFYTDILTPGYDSEATHFSYKQLHLLNEIYMDDQLVLFDNMKLTPHENEIGEIGFMEGYTHLGSCYCIHPEINQSLLDELVELIKHEDRDIRFGISMMTISGFTLRILGNRTADIEHVLLKVQKHINELHYQRPVAFLRKY
ncbi:urease accessory protein UreD [Macrococcus equipercicus]|nr:urease accessory protein UreD [Macrococcus equipercicus]